MTDSSSCNSGLKGSILQGAFSQLHLILARSPHPHEIEPLSTALTMLTFSYHMTLPCKFLHCCYDTCLFVLYLPLLEHRHPDSKPTPVYLH